MGSGASGGRSIECDRVGVVEVGSGGVRLLVADVSLDGSIHAVHTEWTVMDLVAAEGGGQDSVKEKILEVNGVVTAYIAKARDVGGKKVKAFGTEALRRIRSRYPGIVEEIVPEVDVLSEHEEARCSLLAGAKGRGRPLSLGDTFLVCDLGAGSLEIVTGEVGAGSSVGLLENVSYPLGYETLMKEMKKKQGKMKDVFLETGDKLRRWVMPAVPKGAETVVLGRVVTNLTWVIHGGDGAHYHPKAVHEWLWRREEIDNLLQRIMRESGALSAFIRLTEKRYPKLRTEWIRLLVGMFVIVHILERMDRQSFYVSAYGTRFGMAFLLSGA